MKRMSVQVSLALIIASAVIALLVLASGWRWVAGLVLLADGAALAWIAAAWLTTKNMRGAIYHE